jgi:tetratricopeptide (TPR) repeat protein
LAPGQGRIVLRAAATLERLGRSDQALARYREAMTLAATDREAASARAGASRVMMSLAATDARLGRFAEAAEQYARAVALDGASEEARVGEASSLLLAGRWVPARSRLEGSTRVLPASARLRHLLARLLAACPDRALRDGERAVLLAEELWRADPTPARAETLAMALAETGSYERAAALQSELLRDRTAADGGTARADSAHDPTVTRLAADLERYRRGERCCASTDPSLLLP